MKRLLPDLAFTVLLLLVWWPAAVVFVAFYLGGLRGIWLGMCRGYEKGRDDTVARLLV